MKRSRDRGRREESSEGGTLRRSSSVKGRNEKGKKSESSKGEDRQEKHKGTHALMMGVGNINRF